jgi:hypothetical protein
MATKDWQTLTRLTGGSRIEIERVRLIEQDVAIEGPFELPPLAQLSADDQVFVAAFVRCHGSIKQMEKFFGVSYPTIKNRLNRIGAQFPFMEVEPALEPNTKRASASELLSRLESGEMTAKDVLTKLKPSGEEEKS